MNLTAWEKMIDQRHYSASFLTGVCCMLVSSLAHAVNEARADVSFTPLPFSRAYGVSGDGSTVVGSTFVSPNSIGYRWTAAMGAMPLGNWVPRRASYDGSVIVGASHELAYYGPGPYSGGNAWRWDSVTGSQALPVFPGDTSAGATAVSADGSVVVGWSANVLPGSGGFTPSGSAWRWTQQAGFTQLAQPVNQNGNPLPVGWARDITSSGVSVLGNGTDGGDIWFHGQIGTRWDGNGDTAQPMFIEPPYNWFRPLDSALDGAIILGYGSSGPGPGLFVHGATGYYELLHGVEMNDPLSYFVSTEAISEDGTTVVGYAESAFNDTWRAAVWTQATGGLYLDDMLRDAGVDLTGWELNQAMDVSDDGRTIVGYGWFNGQEQAFVATVPEPTTAGMMSFSLLALLRRTRRN